MATVAGADELGMSMSWERCDVVALDSQGVRRFFFLSLHIRLSPEGSLSYEAKGYGVIGRIQGLMHQQPQSWIEEKLARQMSDDRESHVGAGTPLGVAGNETADSRAKQEVGRAGAGLGGERGTRNWGAAVHCHSLDRLNVINP